MRASRGGLQPGGWPASKLDSPRVLEEAGAAAPAASYRTVLRRLPAYAKEAFRQELSAAHAGLGPASLVLYDIAPVYFQTDAGDGFREPGFSKERRLASQFTVGLLTGLQARPSCHHPRDSTGAHLTIVFAALAVSRWIENQTGWSIRTFNKTARRLSRPGARFRDCSRPVSPGLPLAGQVAVGGPLDAAAGALLVRPA